MRMHVRIWHPDELVTRPDGETISVTELFGESGFPVGQSKLCHVQNWSEDLLLAYQKKASVYNF